MNKLNKVALGLALLAQGNERMTIPQDETTIEPEIFAPSPVFQAHKLQKGTDAIQKEVQSTLQKIVEPQLPPDAEESIQSYQKKCGGEQAVVCRALQDEIRNALPTEWGEWTYASEITWSYDQNGNIVDAAAFPGYQLYIPCGDEVDLISVGVFPPSSTNPQAKFFYGISHHERPLTNSSWSSVYNSPESLGEALESNLEGNQY